MLNIMGPYYVIAMNGKNGVDFCFAKEDENSTKYFNMDIIASFGNDLAAAIEGGIGYLSCEKGLKVEDLTKEEVDNFVELVKVIVSWNDMKDFYLNTFEGALILRNKLFTELNYYSEEVVNYKWK